MNRSTVKKISSIKKAMEKCVTVIAKERDKLRELLSELEDLDCEVTQGVEYLESGIESLSTLL